MGSVYKLLCKLIAIFIGFIEIYLFDYEHLRYEHLCKYKCTYVKSFTFTIY